MSEGGGGGSNSLPVSSCGTFVSSGGNNRDGWNIVQVICARTTGIKWPA